MLSNYGRISGIFNAIEKRIICIINAFVIGYIVRQIRAGRAYWRAEFAACGVVNQKRVGGWNAENSGGADGRGFGKAAAGLGLAEGLAADLQGCGAGNVGAESSGQHVKQIQHNSPQINPARWRLVAYGKNPCLQKVLPLCQRVVDTPEKGESEISMALR